MISKNDSLKLNKKKIGFQSSKLWRILGYIILSLFVSFTLFCIVWLFFSSFKTNNEFFNSIWSLPKKITFLNYVKAWKVLKFVTYYKNSLIVIPISVLITLLVSLPCAYALTRIKFRFRETLSNFIILGMGVPIQLIIIPLFYLLFKIHLNNSLLGLIIAYIAGSVSFSIFLLFGYVKNLPTELEEAAMIDGANPLKVFLRVILPLSAPGLVTVGIFNFVLLWNEYLLAMVILQNPDLRTVSFGLYSLQYSMQYNADWVSLYAGLLIAILPIMIIFLALSELIAESITLGAIKG